MQTSTKLPQETKRKPSVINPNTRLVPLAILTVKWLTDGKYSWPTGSSKTLVPMITSDNIHSYLQSTLKSGNLNI